MSSQQSFRYDEEDLVPISALQHLIFCERQWALIHLEQIWEENQFTAEGNQLHERLDTPEAESRGKLKIVRSLRLRSLKLGLTGIADVVEFHRCSETNLWQPYPVEYKRGKPKQNASDEVQLCAQALCLEEMKHVTVPKGALFYGQSKKRQEIVFDDILRKETRRYIERLHQVVNAKKTPPAKYEKKCSNCSLINWCMPASMNGSKSASQYLRNILAWAANDKEDE